MLALDQLHDHIIAHATHAQLLAPLDNIPIDPPDLCPPPGPHIRKHAADIPRSRVGDTDNQRLEALGREPSPDVGQALELRQRAQHQRYLGQQQPHGARDGVVVQDAAVGGVEQDRQRVDDGVDGQLLQLLLHKVRGGHADGCQDRRARQCAEQISRRLRQVAVRHPAGLGDGGAGG